MVQTPHRQLQRNLYPICGDGSFVREATDKEAGRTAEGLSVFDYWFLDHPIVQEHIIHIAMGYLGGVQDTPAFRSSKGSCPICPASRTGDGVYLDSQPPKSDELPQPQDSTECAGRDSTRGSGCRESDCTDSSVHHVPLQHERKESTVRESRHEWFLDIADKVAHRATCLRAKHGALLVRDDRIIATGFNGSVRKQPHCTEAGCLMENGHCVRTIHAEENAILQCARFGISTIGADLYVTGTPCARCRARLRQVGIRYIIYRNHYDDGHLTPLPEVKIEWC